VLFSIDYAAGYVAADQVLFVDPDVALRAVRTSDGYDLQGSSGEDEVP
jgi:hypothetical protein